MFQQGLHVLKFLLLAVISKGIIFLQTLCDYKKCGFKCLGRVVGLWNIWAFLIDNTSRDRAERSLQLEMTVQRI